MKQLSFILSAALLLPAACTAVKTVKEYVPVERIVKETVTVRDTVVNVRIEQVRDSVVIPLARDTASFLENAYAYSCAPVNRYFAMGATVLAGITGFYLGW